MLIHSSMQDANESDACQSRGNPAVEVPGKRLGCLFFGDQYSEGSTADDDGGCQEEMRDIKCNIRRPMPSVRMYVCSRGVRIEV